MRKKKSTKNNEEELKGDEQTMSGIIQSIDKNSINPIYVKIKQKIVKISVFSGIKPAALSSLPIIQNLE